MNHENIISLPAATGVTIPPFRRLKMTATGVDLAGAADRCIGTSVPGDLNRNQVTVLLHGRFAEAELGNTTAVVAGDEIAAAANGRVVKRAGEATAVGVAVPGANASQVGDRFDVIYYAG
jgi:hypothetical protein